MRNPPYIETFTSVANGFEVTSFLVNSKTLCKADF